mmetsp:Transcript_6186/g.8605  ORF Transcript_6186/g.8605 Transcript_6186/m.8605 type:complete len:146 (-) Transcript_6186:1697-2134(-)
MVRYLISGTPANSIAPPHNKQVCISESYFFSVKHDLNSRNASLHYISEDDDDMLDAESVMPLDSFCMSRSVNFMHFLFVKHSVQKFHVDIDLADVIDQFQNLLAEHNSSHFRGCYCHSRIQHQAYLSEHIRAMMVITLVRILSGT